MNIIIISVGKIKEKFMVSAVEEYTKRLSRYCKLSIVEVPDEKAPENLSEKEMEQIKGAEGESILKHVKEGMYVIVLDIQGKMLSSEKFAEMIEDLGLQGNSSIAFVIGGSLGLSGKVLSRADYRLSFSHMTFPHQLMRVILLEQIYRGFRIMKNEPYHK
ncbi:23S rRNA (pseudouridine(1915)-N(3))-methyltransferase RlmH [Geosporobacter ferrireducens]|uniref:23S rRNA (pseudouridine(1915)-N(3))-methyltransferase RlmH n=1 Tax=Geosporobacter ferrireducens TaxID=1424294 RepID=UPI00139AD817|nr:23S rRNA (pseudouridine(1915)-N(3))-methyltransferase RlmH [Geosporobacter ferrireducens]MTI57087.1 23S rRNA (pseudouridine(1915)-N(3))-methyltransferase RlmH [Geosporobacter ferrireducens]